jgi:hypothetical protein
MIVQDSAGSLYRVVPASDEALAHVWMGYPVKRSAKTPSGYAPKSTNGQPRLIRKVGCVVVSP